MQKEAEADGEEIPYLTGWISRDMSGLSWSVGELDNAVHSDYYEDLDRFPFSRKFLGWTVVADFRTCCTVAYLSVS